nr:MAG TPA: hypothetical protein [Caudoviricetes sp.]
MFLRKRLFIMNRGLNYKTIEEVKRKIEIE